MEFLTGGLPKSDFEISYVSDSVVLELSWSLRIAACMGSHGWIAEVGP